MDVTLANPFINATTKVLEIMANVACKAGKPYIKKEKISEGDVTGLIGLSGITKGSIAISFSEKSILEIVSSMLGEKIIKINTEITDAVGEITNMVSGQARKELAEAGRVFNAAIPSVVTGKDHIVMHHTKDPIISIPFEAGGGKFFIEICMEDTL